MMFKKTIEMEAKFKKAKEYSFYFSPEDIKKGMKASFGKPHLVHKENDTIIYGLYKSFNGKLQVRAYTGCVEFESI